MFPYSLKILCVFCSLFLCSTHTLDGIWKVLVECMNHLLALINSIRTAVALSMIRKIVKGMLLILNIFGSNIYWIDLFALSNGGGGKRLAIRGTMLS